jgi:hypothetical protein
MGKWGPRKPGPFNDRKCQHATASYTTQSKGDGEEYYIQAP